MFFESRGSEECSSVVNLLLGFSHAAVYIRRSVQRVGSLFLAVPSVVFEIRKIRTFAKETSVLEFEHFLSKLFP